MNTIFTRLGLTPDAWQQRVLETPADRIIVVGARRVGKTTTAAAVALDTAIVEAGSRIVLIDPNQAMSYSLLQNLSEDTVKLGVAVDRRTSDGFTLANGSKIVVRTTTAPGDLRRPHLLIVDEASLVSEATMEAVQLMSADKVVLLSTPARSAGLFHDIWTNAPAGWHREHVPADQCPRINPEILDRAQAAMRPEDYAMEWGARFV